MGRGSPNEWILRHVDPNRHGAGKPGLPSAASAAVFNRCTRSDSVAPVSFVRLGVLHARHIGAALGDSAANRRIRSRIARYNRRGTATSAS
jgi:hypothetical protein